MYMMSADQYASLNKGKTEYENNSMEGAGRTEPADIKIAKLHDQLIRKQDIKKIKSDKQWAELGARLKPILSSVQEANKDVLKQFPEKDHAEVKFVLSVLNRLPKVTISSSELFIDGQPLPDSLTKIIKDINANGIKGVEGVIEKLRTREDDWDIPFESFSKTMENYLGNEGGETSSQGNVASAITPFQSPAKASPVKTVASGITPFQSPAKASPVKTMSTPKASPVHKTRSTTKSKKKELPPVETNQSPGSYRSPARKKKQDGRGRSQGWESY